MFGILRKLTAKAVPTRPTVSYASMYAEARRPGGADVALAVCLEDQAAALGRAGADQIILPSLSAGRTLNEGC